MKKEPNFLNVMKISTFLLSACAFSAFANPYGSQNVLANINGNDYAAVAQQGKKVTGVVVDGSGIPVIGANVVVKGTTNGTITDFDGNYTIEGVPSDAILQVSYIGYLTQEVPVAGKAAINVTLQEDTQTLDEVVVVGDRKSVV